MRWFKHMTNSHDDEILASLFDEFGLEGYGFWWLLLEKVASLMDETDRTFAEYPIKKWRKTFGISLGKFNKLTTYLELSGRLSKQTRDNVVRIEIPNLAKYRDEYTQRRKKTPPENRDKLPIPIGTMSGQTPEQDAEAETELDAEEKKKQKKKSSRPPRKGGRSPTQNEKLPGQKKLSGNHQAFIDVFHRRFQVVNSGSKPTWNGKTTSAVSRLLKLHSLHELIRRVKIYETAFRRKEWPAEKFTLAIFEAHLDRWVEAKDTSKADEIAAIEAQLEEMRKNGEL